MLGRLTLITTAVAAELRLVGNWKVTDPCTTLPTAAEMDACWDHFLMTEEAEPEELPFHSVEWDEALQSFQPCRPEQDPLCLCCGSAEACHSWCEIGGDTRDEFNIIWKATD